MSTTKRKTGYYSRLSVPRDLRSIVGKRELVRSLKTRCRKLAEVRGSAVESHWRRMMYEIRRLSSVLDEGRLKAAVVRYFEEERRWLEESYLTSKPLDDFGAAALELEYGEYMESLYDALRRNDTTEVEGSIDTVLEQAGAGVAVSAYERAKVGQELLKARLALTKLQLARLRGDDEDGWWNSPSGTPPVGPKGSSKALSEAVAEYLEHKQSAGVWTPKTAAMQRSALHDLVEIVGDKPVNEVGKDDMREYQKVLMGLPPRYRQKFPGAPLKEVAARGFAEVIKPKTVNKALTFISGFFIWLHKNDYITDRKDTVLTSVRTQQQAHAEREAFTDEDLRRIFGGSYRDDCRDGRRGPVRLERFWLPLLLAFTGARPEELAQLHKEDVKKQEGIWYIDISAERGRLKTGDSARVVPVHSRLVDLGFIGYVQECSSGHLWPRLNRTEKSGYANAVGQWFNRRLHERLGFPKGKVLYSLRHTVASRLKAQGLHDYEIAELLGHKVEGMSVGRYGKPLDVKRRAELVERLKLPI